MGKFVIIQVKKANFSYFYVSKRVFLTINICYNFQISKNVALFI